MTAVVQGCWVRHIDDIQSCAAQVVRIVDGRLVQHLFLRLIYRTLVTLTCVLSVSITEDDQLLILLLHLLACQVQLPSLAAAGFGRIRPVLLLSLGEDGHYLLLSLLSVGLCLRELQAAGDFSISFDLLVFSCFEESSLM